MAHAYGCNTETCTGDTLVGHSEPGHSDTHLRITYVCCATDQFVCACAPLWYQSLSYTNTTCISHSYVTRM
jgi:hypothetical protein